MDELYLRCLIGRFHWLVGSDCFFLVGVVVSSNCLGFGGFEYDHVSLRLTTLLLTVTGTRASTSLLSRSITLLFSFLLLPFLPIFPESAARIFSESRLQGVYSHRLLKSRRSARVPSLSLAQRSCSRHFSLCWSGIRGWSLQIRQIQVDAG